MLASSGHHPARPPLRSTARRAIGISCSAGFARYRRGV